jgi:hypothetical protein
MENVNFYTPISLDEKYNLLIIWLNQFVEINNNIILKQNDNEIVLFDQVNLNEVIFTKEKKISNKINKSIFYLFDKTYIKTNNQLEREIYKFLYGNKARFTPVNLHS